MGGWGTTPHARGPRHRDQRGQRARGNNPARAGTTPDSSGCRPAWWEQPRTRGDHLGHHSGKVLAAGTTPHARGPPAGPALLAAVRGNNPARAGTTTCHQALCGRQGEQPRTRGDHAPRVIWLMSQPGTTPHARGPLLDRGHVDPADGNNPARAGTTSSVSRRRLRTREQPRTRGDHRQKLLWVDELMGTTPHARGPLDGEARPGLVAGNNPARAGTTRWPSRSGGARREQPRTRGDHSRTASRATRGLGTTPHARGPPWWRPRWEPSIRNNPARAGTTRGCGLLADPSVEQPRTRGDHRPSPAPSGTNPGTTPHARGPHTCHGRS